MPSPFPGMDPYLEEPGLWPDVHHRLISFAALSLTQQLRPKYYARIEERTYISDEKDLIEAEIHEPALKVIERASRTVFAVIEILSPTNKFPTSRGWQSYEQKRHEIMHSP